MPVALGALVMIASASVAADGIRLLPTEFSLTGPENIQRLTVVHLVDGQLAGMVDKSALKYSVSDPAIVEIKNGVAHGLANGTAEIRVETPDGSVAVTQVRVANADDKADWNFRNHVQSVLAKSGCNMGACHGALAGKGGFKLSLRGYDSDADYLSITQKARGRRIELSDPGRSLFLAKPTAALPHKGGLKLEVGSRDYRVLSDWVAAGAKGPADEDPRLERISVTPGSALLRPADQFQILVNAHYSNGETVDVTHWAQFSATDQAIATVDDSGLLKVQGSGEAAVLVWFGSKVALARMTVPYPNDVPADVFQNAARSNFIDELNLQQLETLRLPPSPAV